MRTLATILVTALTLGICAHDSRADLYGDVKDIIEQVIETNISTQVIPNAAARIPALCSFFPSSLAAIQARRYTGLQTVLRKEIADAVGYVIFRSLSSAPPGVDKAPRASDLVEYAKRSSNAQLAENFAIAPALDQLTGRGAEAVPKTCVPAKNGKLGFDDVTSVATIQLQKCTAKQEDDRSELACAAAILMSDSFDDQRDALPADLDRLLRAMLGTEVDSIKDLLTSLAARQTVGMDAALAIAVEVANTCNTVACHRVRGWLASKQGQIDDLVAIINVLRSHNYGSATAKLFHLVVDVRCADSARTDNPACTKQGQAVRAFLESLAVVVIDSATSGKTIVSAEADFRAAAVNMISETGGGLGYTRYPWTVGALLYPQLTLRKTWRPGHPDAGASPTVMYASLDTLTVRPKAWYRPSWYVAPQLSLLDLMGPFSEVATRGHLFDDAAHKVLVFGLGFVVPRAEIIFGSPLLSRNIVVGAGVTVRAYRGVMTGVSTAEYCILGKACSADNNERGFTWDNLEVGVYLRYVP
jgi:hypothetical protein